MFIENYKKYACDFIFQSEDVKLGELLNVKPKCKIEDKATATEAIIAIPDPLTLSQTKRSMYELVLTQI